MSETNFTTGATGASATSGPWLKPSAALARGAKPAPLAHTAMRSHVVRFGYRIGSLNFLVGATVLSELLPASATYPIPNVPESLRGYVNRQGALVPVWDLKSMLGLTRHDLSDDSADAVTAHAASQDARTKESILLLGRGDRRVGLVIDGLPRSLKKLERAAKLPQLPDILEPFVKGSLFGDDTLWFEFDYEGFFSAQTHSAAQV